MAVGYVALGVAVQLVVAVRPAVARRVPDDVRWSARDPRERDPAMKPTRVFLSVQTVGHKPERYGYSHEALTKSPAQLDAEIAEALARKP